MCTRHDLPQNHHRLQPADCTYLQNDPKYISRK